MRICCDRCIVLFRSDMATPNKPINEYARSSTFFVFRSAAQDIICATQKRLGFSTSLKTSTGIRVIFSNFFARSRLSPMEAQFLSKNSICFGAMSSCRVQPRVNHSGQPLDFPNFPKSCSAGNVESSTSSSPRHLGAAVFVNATCIDPYPPVAVLHGSLTAVDDLFVAGSLSDLVSMSDVTVSHNRRSCHQVPQRS